MFGLSFTHLIILVVIALVVIGPEQLPEVARTLARLLNEWKRATGDIQSTLTNHLRDDVMRRDPPRPPNVIANEAQHVDAKVQPIEAEPKPIPPPAPKAEGEGQNS